MGFSLAYNIIGELALWHHRHLDGPPGGAFTLPPPPPAPFPAPPDALLQRLMDYDVRRWMEIRPTPDTETLLEQNNLLFRTGNRGALIVSKAGFAPPPGEHRLTLVLRPVDTRFLSYTDFDTTIAGNGLPSLQGKVFLFSTFGLPAGSAPIGGKPGHPQVHTDNLVDLKTRVVRLPQTVPGQASQVRVFAQNSTDVQPKKTFDLPAVTDQTHYELDCRSLPEGYYRFEGANIATTRHYLGLESIPSPLAVVELMLSGITFPTRYDLRFAKTT